MAAESGKAWCPVLYFMLSEVGAIAVVSISRCADSPQGALLDVKRLERVLLVVPSLCGVTVN